MRSPAKRPLAFVAEYQFGEDNVLTATHHEEMRLKNEARVRNARSILKMEGLTLGGDMSPTHNLKKLQQEQDRLDEIDQHNLILLQRLEHIHQHLPKQFDVSHHSEAVQSAPRATNIGLRRRQYDQIEVENQRMERRLHNVKGSLDRKKLAVDAERHDYFSEQLSKVTRRRKVQATVKHLTNLSAVKHDQAHHPEPFYVYGHVEKLGRQKYQGDRYQDQREDDDDDYLSHTYDTRRIRDGPSLHSKLPSIRLSASQKYVPQSTRSLTLTNTAKVISASDLLYGFK